MKNFIKKHPSAWRYISVIAMLLLVFPVTTTTAYAGNVGKYIGMVVYMILASYASYEVVKNTGASKLVQIFIALSTLVLFAHPWEPLNSNSIGNVTTSISSAISTLISWESVLVLVLLLLVAAFDPKLYSNKKTLLPKMGIIIVSTLVITLFAKTAWIINMVSYGKFVFFISIAIVADSFAYFGGKYFGKKLFRGAKMAPKISPKKTWAGFAIGSILAGIFVGLVGYYSHAFASTNYEITVVIIASILLPTISALGDLLFSLFKRYLKIKDFSQLMPGHGGIMDRLDAISVVITTILIIFLSFNI